MTNKTEIEQYLIERNLILTQLAEIKAGYEEMKKRILTPKLLSEVEAIDAECAETSKSAAEKLSELEDKIRSGVVKLGTSVKVENVGHAVFVKGRITWDTEDLMRRSQEEQYSWLKNYYTQGDPSCTIRKG